MTRRPPAPRSASRPGRAPARRTRAGWVLVPVPAGGDSGNSRVQDRLGQLRADYEARQAGEEKPAAVRREAPTQSMKAEKLRENAERELAADDSDDDPEELAEARETLQNNEDPDERIGAVLMLTGDEGPESMRMLLEAMDDPDPEVRLAVVEALGDRAEELTPSTARPAAARSRRGSALRGGQHPRRHGRPRSAAHMVTTALQRSGRGRARAGRGHLDFADDDDEPDDQRASASAPQPAARQVIRREALKARAAARVDAERAALLELSARIHAHPELCFERAPRRRLAGRLPREPRLRRRARRLRAADGLRGARSAAASRASPCSASTTRCPASATPAATTSSPPPAPAPASRWPRSSPRPAAASSCSARRPRRAAAARSSWRARAPSPTSTRR